MAALDYRGIGDVGEIPNLDQFGGAPAVDPAGDGVPRKKACEECAFKEQANIGPILDQCSATGLAFYCIHDTNEDSQEMVCACFAAFDRVQGITEAGRRALLEREDG